MPRKKIASPATAAQVLDYFEAASDVEVQLVASLVEAQLKKRFASKLTPSAPTGIGQVGGRKARKPRVQAPTQYGETLGEA